MVHTENCGICKQMDLWDNIMISNQVLMRNKAVALLRVSCSAPACHPKRHRREGWLTIVNELRTTYYADIMNIAIEFEKLNKTTNDLYFDDN